MKENMVWAPAADRIRSATLTRFRTFASDRVGRPFADSMELHAWSISELGVFWDTVWDFFSVIGEKGGKALTNDADMLDARFFPESRLNFAENLLRKTPGVSDADDALVFRAEDHLEERWSWSKLRSEVSRLAEAMRAEGVGPGDRVAALLPNRPEAIAAMLATASIGGVWTSASPDFGPRGVLDRFGQVEPKLLFATDGYWYAGKRVSLAAKLTEVVGSLPSVKRTIVLDQLGDVGAVTSAISNSISLKDFVRPASGDSLQFTRLPFDHPLFILFSSGTTGAPKCIVHRAGGALLQHLKEIGLHADVHAGDRLFYFTTLGWMMWNWQASALACGATLLLYDGSPFHPSPSILFDYADAERMTHFGTSAKYIDAIRKSEFRPAKSHRLSSVRTMLSTGSPLAAESFDFVYSEIKSDVHLASISGGTDIVSCFVLGDPTRPVFRGEIQGPGLGMAVDVWTEAGQPAAVGKKGELVCTKPFPVILLGFYGDETGERFTKAYFDRFPNVWQQGDFAERTNNRGFIIHGRSDATLNPGGVRIGTAEIYAQVEAVEDVVEAIAVGQEFEGDVRIVLFVKLRPGAEFDDALDREIRTKIRNGASPRHVPSKIIPIADIPRTKSGKIVELAVRDMINGIEVRNVETLANPEALQLFKDLAPLLM